MNRRRIPYGVLGPNRRGRTSLHGAVLLYQLFNSLDAIENKPPVTLFIIALNLLLFYLPTLRPFFPPHLLPLHTFLTSRLKPSKACLNPRAVLRDHRFRLLLSSVIHVDDLHLLYNMSSFLYKALILETSLGSPVFLALLVYLAFAAHSLYILIAYLAHHLSITSRLLDNCVVGFSGVIFGLKVVLNSHPRFSQHATRLLGFSLPAGYAPWMELILASALMPNVSFLGHLTGILAGLAYVYVPHLLATRMPRNAMSWANWTRRNQWTAFQGRGRYARVHDD